jgi:hypothetical protein
VSWDLILRHCAAMRAGIEQTRASLELQSAQLAGLEAYARANQDTATARQELPDHCNGIADEQCGLRSEDAWINHGSLSTPKARYCRGCRALSSNGVTLDP